MSWKRGVLAAFFVACAAGGYWLTQGPELHAPSDLSDLIGTPDSPIEIVDVSDLRDRVQIDRDLPVMTRDGVRLSANLFRPKGDGPFPVAMMITAYHKDEDPTRYPDYLRRNAQADYGMSPIRVSEWTP